MITSRLRGLFPILFLSLLTACAGTVKPEPVAEAAPPGAAKADATLPGVVLEPEILYNLLLGEIAGQRGQIGVAAATLGEVAQQTRDPRVAERATLAALYAKRYDEALQSARLWTELRPHDTEAREALITTLLELDRAAEAQEHFQTLFAAEETRRNLDQAYLRRRSGKGAGFRRRGPETASGLGGGGAVQGAHPAVAERTAEGARLLRGVPERQSRCQPCAPELRAFPGRPEGMAEGARGIQARGRQRPG
jgi:hypothetical protein